MGELYLMVSITNRKQHKRFQRFYKDCKLGVSFQTLGRGTAANEMLDYLGLEASEKDVLLSPVTGENWERVKKGLQTKLRIDVPGTGVAFLIPISSIGGKRQMMFLMGQQKFELGEESTLKDTNYELLVAIANQGYTSLVMDAARAAGASGGTVLHAKGTGMERAEQFLGVSLVAEKELVLIVVKRAKKNDIMGAIMADAGLDSPAGTIVFSLPVTSTAGMRLIEEDGEP
ncbi:MAG: P-II family nitrogen regulator [Clostridiales bacterium]|nr:P-II family nitrogen regulator [Clostridiales bacterium]